MYNVHKQNLAIVTVVLEAVVQLELILEMETFLEEIRGCTYTFFLGGIHLVIMLITIKNPGMFFCFNLLR
uniref:Ovule protein n=1 Tax=Strongyloides stercoralis TaxID=6248 RepID=A0A0K0E4W5_STRER